MNFNQRAILGISVFFIFLMMVSGADALSVSVSQSGADSDEVMKGRTFTVEASGWTGDCSQATISFSGCSSCSLSGESTVKTISEGTSTVSWTTVSASNKASSQYVSVTVSSGCTGQSEDSSTFDIVLPPSLSVEATTDDSSIDEGDTFEVNLNIANNGETTANDVTTEVSGTGMSISSGCSSISSLEESQSSAQTCTITASSAGDPATATFTVSASNADSSTDSVSITVNSVDGNGDGDGTTGGDGDTDDIGGLMPSTPAGVQNKSKKFDLVPGKGLRNNTKLQTAIQKVLGKANMNQNAFQNLMRLSESITSETDVNKNMEASQTRSNVTMTVKYRGQKRVKNFMLHEKVPKAFAQSASDITVTAPGATYEIAEEDPEFVFLYPEVSSGETLIITYSVDGEVDTSALDSTETVLYAESYEGAEPGQICSPGERRCSGLEVQECSDDGKAWETVKTCEEGCMDAKCTGEGFGLELPPFIKDNLLLVGAAIAVIIVLIAAAVLVTKKKGGKKGLKLPKPMPGMKERPDI